MTLYIVMSFLLGQLITLAVTTSLLAWTVKKIKKQSEIQEENHESYTYTNKKTV